MADHPGAVPHVVSGTSDVLVVCHANITRSPLMASLLASEWGGSGVTVGSAGVRAMVGSGADPGSVREASVRGLELTHHVSRQVTAEMVQDAGLVLTMSESQRDECIHLVPDAVVRCFTVPEAVRLAGVAGPVGLRAGIPGLSRAWHGARMVAPHPEGREDVPDPHGGPLEGFVRMALAFDRWVSVLTASE